MTTEAIPPGGEGQVKAAVRTAGRQGKLTKSITVFSNDPKTPQLRLTLQAEIVVDVTMTPRAVSFGQLSKNKKVTREFSLIVNEPDKVKITGVTIKDKRFLLKLKSGDPAKDPKYELTYTGGKKLGRISAPVRITLSGAKADHVDLNVSGQVVGDLRYSKSVYLPKAGGKFRSRTVTFTSRSGKTIRLLGVKDQGGHLTTEIIEAKGEKVSFKIDVTDPNKAYGSAVREKLIVKTNDPDEPVIEIVYTIADRKAARGRGLRNVLKPGLVRGQPPMSKPPTKGLPLGKPKPKVESPR